MNNPSTHRLGVDIVIRDADGKVLLIKRTDDHSWCMPGGWVEAGETPDQAIVREVMEETGLTLHDMEIAGVTVRESGTVHLTYRAKRYSGDIRGSDEGREVAFISMDDVDVWHRDHKERIEQIL